VEALLRVRDVAGLLQLHQNTIYRLVERGELVPTRVGGSLRFSMRDVEAYAERSRVVPPTRIEDARADVRVIPLPPGMTLDDINVMTGRTLREDLIGGASNKKAAVSGN
jgi:excisionase family DNA binding protein